MALNRFVAAIDARVRRERPAEPRQGFLGRVRDAGLQVELAWLAELLAGGFISPFMVPARRIPRLLQPKAIVHEVGDDLRLTLWLHVPAHDAEAHQRGSILRREPRDDGLERPLARRIDVG